MPRGGHNRKSKEQAEATGTARRDRHSPAAKLAPGVPAKPWGMSAKAEELWDEFIPQLAESGVLERIDALGLAQLFEAASLAVLARDIVGEALVYEDYDAEGNITLKKHPGIGVWKDAVSTLRGLLADHGMTPLARVALGKATAPPGENAPQLPGGAPAAFKPKVVRGGK